MGAIMLKSIVVALTMTVSSWPLSARAELIGLDQLFKPKEQVAYFEIYHIAHESTSYRTAIPLSEVIRPSSQDYVRVSERNWRALDALYDAFSKTGIDRDLECPGRPEVLDVRWAIVVTYKDGSHDAVGFNDLRDCVQSSRSAKPWPSGRGLYVYAIQNFPFMK
jgi:hypothetical protein